MESGKIYSVLVDPILKPMRERVASKIKVDEKVIDIACGTGAQLYEISGIASSMTGVDLSESMIEYATKRNIPNSLFLVNDASKLSVFNSKSFDVAILTLALHQFSLEIYEPVLKEIKRIANKLIVADYAVPLPKNYAGYGSRVAEFLAGVEHNRNFKSYYKMGGLNVILQQNDFEIIQTEYFGKGAFQLVICQ